jgi:2',3'-cyclic-nucleotide 2'-phosphodiesterase (5'-nucleotidase family)
LKKDLYYIVLLLISITFQTSCKDENHPIAGNDNSDEIIPIVLLHTNDVHSHIDNFAKLAAYKQELEENYKHVFLLSAGDIFSGGAENDRYPEKYFPIIDLMNISGYNVHTIGNHEFDGGLEVLKERIEDSKFPWISANIDFSPNSIEIKNNSSIKLYAGDIILKVVGLTQVDKNGYPSCKKSNCEQTRFIDPFEKMKETALEEDTYDALIALSHLGVYDTKFYGDRKLAISVPILDLIIGGHSHTKMTKSIEEEGVMIVQAGSYLSSVGKTILYFQNGEIIKKEFELIDLNNYSKEDAAVKAKISEYNDAPHLKEVVGQNNSEMDRPEIAYFLCDAVKDYTNTDIAFINEKVIRAYPLEAGDITLNDIYTFNPFDNQMITFSVDSAGLYDFIWGYVNGGDAWVNNMVCSEGFNYRLYTNESGGVEKLELNIASELDRNNISISTGDYVFEKVYADNLPENENIGEGTNQAMILYLKKKKEIDYKGVSRVEVVEE